MVGNLMVIDQCDMVHTGHIYHQLLHHDSNRVHHVNRFDSLHQYHIHSLKSVLEGIYYSIIVLLSFNKVHTYNGNYLCSHCQ